MPIATLVRRLAAILVAIGAVTALAACSPDSQGGAGDAPIASVEQDPWVIMNNVDGFPNLAFRCRGVNGIYLTRSADDSSDTMQVIPNDPSCSTGGLSSTSVPR